MKLSRFISIISGIILDNFSFPVTFEFNCGTRLEFEALISDSADVLLTLCSIWFTLFQFSNILFDFDCSFQFSLCLSDVPFIFFVVRLLSCDSSANSYPDFKFNFACSDNLLVTYFSTYLSFGTARPTGF